MNPLTQRHRAQQLLLRQATISATGRIWSLLDYERLDVTFPALAVVAAKLADRNRSTSAGLAAAYVRELRRAEKVPGQLIIRPAGALDPDAFTTSLRVVSLAAVKSATGRGVAADVAMTNALTQTQGVLARTVLNGGRETVLASLVEDRHARGYQRVLGGAGCDFCQMLAERGAVYSAETADFQAHDRCGCTAEPVYRA